VVEEGKVRKMIKKNTTDEKTKEMKGECENKKRYLKDTVFQAESLKWLFISFALIIFGAAKHIKYMLLLFLVLDLFQTKYLFGLKNSKYVKYLLNSLIIVLFIMNLKMFIIRNIVEVIIIIILVYIFNEKLAKSYNQFMELDGMELDGGKNEEKE